MKIALLGFAALCLFTAPSFANEEHKEHKDQKTTATDTKKDEHKDKVAATCEKCQKAKAECHCEKKVDGKKG